MRILLDENLPRKLVEALRAEGHAVESVHTLQQAGIDNGALYGELRTVDSTRVAVFRVVRFSWAKKCRGSMRSPVELAVKYST